MDDYFGRLQSAIERRQDEMHQLAAHLGQRARLNRWVSTVAKFVLVLLGAVAATKSTVDQILGASSSTSTIVYASLGVAVASIAGISAAFNFEQQAAQLTQLAAETWSTLRNVDTEWRRRVASGASDRTTAALEILDLQDAQLGDIQARAARLGINIAIDIPALIKPGPYAA